MGGRSTLTPPSAYNVAVPMGSTSQIDGMKHTVAVACRILAHAGLAEDVLGHVSVRLDADQLLVRCRGPRELGLLYTVADDVRVVGFDGSVDDDRYAPPGELPIHTRAMERRPDAAAVVHAHPPEVIAADLAGEPFCALVGAYNIPAARMAADGIPVYARAVLIRRNDLADEMLDAMGDRPVCVLRGHGITAVGATVEEAVVRALALNSLASMIGRVVALGGEVRPIPDDDLAELPDLGANFNTQLVWRHHEHRLRLAGLLPADDDSQAAPASTNLKPDD